MGRLIPTLEINPSKGVADHVWHLLHTQKGSFMGLGTGNGNIASNSNTSHSQVAQSQADKVTPAIAHLVEQVSHLHQRVDEITEEGRNHKANDYNMLTRPELEKKIESQPIKHRICKLHLRVSLFLTFPCAEFCSLKTVLTVFSKLFVCINK